LQRWITTYKNNGIEQLLNPVKRDKPSKIITPEIHNALESRLTNPDNPFSGYVEVQEWLKKKYGVDIVFVCD
jgi:transposase